MSNEDGPQFGFTAYTPVAPTPIDAQPIWTEAEIIINGRRLTHAESMTVRVALESFAGDVARKGLGEDHLGQALTAGYLARIQSIRTALYRTTE